MEISNEVLLVIGIVLASVGFLGGIVSLIVYKIRKIKLWAKFDREYGISK